MCPMEIGNMTEKEIYYKTEPTALGATKVLLEGVEGTFTLEQGTGIWGEDRSYTYRASYEKRRNSNMPESDLVYAAVKLDSKGWYWSYEFKNWRRNKSTARKRWKTPEEAAEALTEKVGVSFILIGEPNYTAIDVAVEGHAHKLEKIFFKHELTTYHDPSLATQNEIKIKILEKALENLRK